MTGAWSPGENLVGEAVADNEKGLIGTGLAGVLEDHRRTCRCVPIRRLERFAGRLRCGLRSAALPAGMSKSAQSIARGIIVVRASHRDFIARGWAGRGMRQQRRLSNLDCRGSENRMRRVALLGHPLSASLKQWFSPLSTKCLGDAKAKILRGVEWTRFRRDDAISTIGVEYSRIEGKQAGIGRPAGPMSIASPGSHGDDAAPLELRQHGPLRRDGAVSRRVIQRREQVPGASIVPAALDAQGPLPYSGEKGRGLEPLGDVSVQAQAMQARPGEDHGIELPRKGLVQSGLDVSPDRHHIQITAQIKQLGPAPSVSWFRPEHLREGLGGSGGSGRSAHRQHPRARALRRGPIPRAPASAGP